MKLLRNLLTLWCLAPWSLVLAIEPATLTAPPPPAATGTDAAGPDAVAELPDQPLIPAPATATEEAERETASATAEQVQGWIKDLVHPKFATRQQASQQLLNAGVQGVEAVAAAAQTDDLELATRCLAILADALASTKTDVSLAAKDALRQLSTSDNQSVARRAQQALANPSVEKAAQNFVSRVQVRVVNGMREINAVEGGKTVKINDNNSRDIVISVTEEVMGKKKTTTYQAKDETDLKKFHPDGHALFEKYTKPAPARFGIARPAFERAEVARGVRRIVNPLKVADLLGEVDELRKKLEILNERLMKAADAESPDKEELQSISREIHGTTKRLTEIGVEAQLP